MSSSRIVPGPDVPERVTVMPAPALGGNPRRVSGSRRACEPQTLSDQSRTRLTTVRPLGLPSGSSLRVGKGSSPVSDGSGARLRPGPVRRPSRSAPLLTPTSRCTPARPARPAASARARRRRAAGRRSVCAPEVQGQLVVLLSTCTRPSPAALVAPGTFHGRERPGPGHACTPAWSPSRARRTMRSRSGTSGPGTSGSTLSVAAATEKRRRRQRQPLVPAGLPAARTRGRVGAGVGADGRRLRAGAGQDRLAAVDRRTLPGGEGRRAATPAGAATSSRWTCGYATRPARRRRSTARPRRRPRPRPSGGVHRLVGVGERAMRSTTSAPGRCRPPIRHSPVRTRSRR